MVEMAVQLFKVLQVSASMLADLALMTVQAQLAPVSNVPFHTRPHKLTEDCRENGLFFQMSKTVDSVKHLLTLWC